MASTVRGCACTIDGSRATTAENAHHRDVFERKQAVHALPASRRPPTPPKRTPSRAERRLQRAHQLGAELVAGFLADHERDMERRVQLMPLAPVDEAEPVRAAAS